MSILQKTILDFVDISDKERDCVWNSFECLRFADLNIPSAEWDRLHYYSIYQEDFLEDVLALSIEYIYKIWHDKARFNEILNNVLDWVEIALGYDVSFVPDVIKELSDVPREDTWMAVYNPHGWIYFPMKLGIKKYIWIAVYNSIHNSYVKEEKAVEDEKANAKNKEACALIRAIQDKFKPIAKTDDRRNNGIIKMRIRGATLESAGQKYGFTRETVRQIEQKMLDKFNSFLSKTEPYYILQTFAQSNVLLSVDEIQHYLGELSEFFIYCLKKCKRKDVLWSDALNGFIIGDSSWYMQLIKYIDTLPDMFEDSAMELESYASSFIAASRIEIDSSLIYKLILSNYKPVGNFFSKRKLNKAEVYLFVLKRYYPGGIKLFGDLKMMQFRNYAKDLFGDIELPENDRAICARIADLTVLCDRGKYILPDQIRVDEKVLNNIHQFIVDSDRNVIMFGELFERFKSELLDKTSINNRFYLQGVLRYKYEKEFYFAKDLLIKDINSEQGIKLSIAIEWFIREQGRIITKDEISEEFLGIAQSVLQSAIANNPNILLWDTGKYLHAEQLMVDNAVKERLKRLLDGYTGQGSVSVHKIYHDIYLQENEFLMNNHIEGHIALYSVLNLWFPDDYEFRRPYIAPKGSTATTFDTMIREYLANLDEIYISDIKDYVENMRKGNFSINALFDDISDEFIRVDDDLLLRKNRLNLSEDVIENIEETTLAFMGNNGYLSVKKPIDFLFYPNVGTRWTPFLLVSTVKYFGKRLKIISATSDYRYLNEVIVDSSLNINSYDELLHYALKHESRYTPFKNLDEMVEFLLEQKLIVNNIPRSLFDKGYIMVEEYGGIRLNS